MSGLLSTVGQWSEQLNNTYYDVMQWVKYGDPTQAYIQLIYLFQGFCDLCSQHGIEYWLDWGSLLGYLRHDGGLIPWDYDHDVGMTTQNFHAFIALIEKLKKEAEESGQVTSSVSPDSVNSSHVFVLSDFTFHTAGQGYYVMSLASHPTIQVDIVEYVSDVVEGVTVWRHNMDDATVEGFYYPDYPEPLLFPLKHVDMLGVSTLIPRDGDHVTRLHFSDWRMIPRIPYTLSLLYHPFRLQQLFKPPVLLVPEAASISEGMRRFGDSSPFIVRAPDEFAHVTLKSIIDFCEKSDATVFGYDNDGELKEHLPVSRLVRDWQSDRLQCKVLDSPLSVAQLPVSFTSFDVDPESPNTPSNAAQSIVLSKSNSYTFLHVDPPFFGGGWMYLAAGVKSWQFISPTFIPTLFDEKSERLKDYNVAQLLERYSFAFHSHVRHVTARAGDFIYFPPAWMHRVRTFEKAIGVSGYLRLRKAHASMQKYTNLLESMNLNSIWNGNKAI